MEHERVAQQPSSTPLYVNSLLLPFTSPLSVLCTCALCIRTGVEVGLRETVVRGVKKLKNTNSSVRARFFFISFSFSLQTQKKKGKTESPSTQK